MTFMVGRALNKSSDGNILTFVGNILTFVHNGLGYLPACVSDWYRSLQLLSVVAWLGLTAALFMLMLPTCLQRCLPQTLVCRRHAIVSALCIVSGGKSCPVLILSSTSSQVKKALIIPHRAIQLN